ncbi:MAG: hypothetical protein ACYDIC_10025 [Desulfobaccales bacterium]
MDFLIKVIVVLAGLAIGFITYKVSGAKSEVTGLLSILIGLISTQVINNIIEFHRHAQYLKETNQKLAGLLQKVSEPIQTTAELYNILRYGVTKITKEQIPNAWLELLWKIESRYYGLSYTNPDFWWNQAFSKLAIEIQRVKKNVSKAEISRIFIYKNEEELIKLEEVMAEQCKAGITVRHISEESIEKKVLLKKLRSKIKTLDYGLIDAKIVLLVYVDKDRQFKHGEIIVNKEVFDTYKIFYDHLFDEAEEFLCRGR